MADGFTDVHKDGTVNVLDLIDLLLASGPACRSHPHSAARAAFQPADGGLAVGAIGDSHSLALRLSLPERKVPSLCEMKTVHTGPSGGGPSV